MNQYQIQGERIRQLCKEQGITQKALADRIGVFASDMSRYVNGSKKLSYDRAIRIEKEFPQYPHEWLIGQNDDKLPINISNDTAKYLLTQILVLATKGLEIIQELETVHD